MKILMVLGLLALTVASGAKPKAGPPVKSPGTKAEPVKADGLVFKASGEFWEDRMPMMPVPKTPEDNAGRFHAATKVVVANEGRKAVANITAVEVIVYYGGTTREFCRFKPSPVGETLGSAAVAPGRQITLEYSGNPETIGALRDSMTVYGQILVAYGRGKRIAVLTPEAKIVITY